jgi:hypothetical protein
MDTLSPTYNYKGNEHLVYKDVKNNLEFIFAEGEEEKFRDLLKQYGSSEKIPANISLTGFYFNEGTRKMKPEIENSFIVGLDIRMK